MKKRIITKRFRLIALMLSIIMLVSLMSPLHISADAASNKETIRSYRTISDDEYYPEDYIGYVYPIRPGTSEWAALPDHKAMVEACEIPEAILTNMSTEALFQSVLAYPLIVDIFAYDDWNTGLDIVSDNFNGLCAYEDRADNTEVIIQSYSELSTNFVNHNSRSNLLDEDLVSHKSTLDVAYSSSRDVLYSMVMGVLLADEAYFNKLCESDYQLLCSSAEKMCITNDQPILNQISDMELIGGAAEKSSSDWSYVYRLDYFWYHVNSTPIAGPNNSTVTAYTNVCYERWVCSDGYLRPYTDRLYADLPTSYKTTINNQMYDVYGINPLSQPTVKYNCHSYAWYQQATTNPYWIDDISPYLNSGRYSVVGQMNTSVGDRVVYYSSTNHTYSQPSHSAVITSYTNITNSQRSFTLKSKWGMAGLYSHSLTNCPYYYGESAEEQMSFFYDYRFYS